MPLDTYSDLKAAIIDEMDRDDLSDKVDDFIDLAEARHKSEIRIRDMIVRAQASFTTRYLALPDGFLEMKTLRLLTSPCITIPQEIDLGTMNRRRQERDGRPRFFTIHEEIEFDVDVADADPITAEMIYYKALTPLSDANTSNALLSRSPGAYLYGALVASAPWLSEDERIGTWNSLYNAAVEALVLSDRNNRYGTPISTSVAGPTP